MLNFLKHQKCSTIFTILALSLFTSHSYANAVNQSRSILKIELKSAVGNTKPIPKMVKKYNAVNTMKVNGFEYHVVNNQAFHYQYKNTAFCQNKFNAQIGQLNDIENYKNFENASKFLNSNYVYLPNEIFDTYVITDSIEKTFLKLNHLIELDVTFKGKIMDYEYGISRTTNPIHTIKVKPLHSLMFVEIKMPKQCIEKEIKPRFKLPFFYY